MSIAEYFEWYILYIPHSVYVWGGAAFLLVLATAMCVVGNKDGIRYGVAFLFAEYVALLLYFTVFARTDTGCYEYALIPFWSYRVIHEGVEVLIQEVAMNIAVMIPVGFLLGVCMKRATWWKVALLGGCISLTVELLQLVLRRGCCETDDIIHNVLGCLLGYFVGKLRCC